MSQPISPVLTSSPVGPRRRPSGEPPPLPRRIDATTRWYLLAVGLTAGLWAGLSYSPVLRTVTRFDLATLRLIAETRTAFLTGAMRDLAAVLGSPWTVRLAAVATIATLVVFRRFGHLAAYLAVEISAALVASAAVLSVGRMRPAGIDVLDRWEGYADPSHPVALLALATVGALYTLVPAGRWRNRARWAALAPVVLLGLARLYLAVDHPSDVLAGLGVGWALPVVAFRLLVPDDVFPVVYHPGRRAHLDVGGTRGEAIVRALNHQLGLDVERVEPFGLEGSAGSTPLRLHLRPVNGDAPPVLFAKLYALNHLRSDRWYKLARMILYGRLEDEKPFSTVRRLVEYEDHMLRLLRDAGLPVPEPYGFVEITPEREYVIVMEFFPEAVEIGVADVGDVVVRDALAIVRRLWDAGVAHRDIKPSNVLVQDGRVVLIDVAFATVRPTPWRQAVDLANMMLTVGLRSTPETVYRVALDLFAADDVAEAFAASRGITVPTQLRERLRADGRDLAGRFRRLAPERPAVPIQLWSLHRVALTVGVFLAASLAVAATFSLLLTGSTGREAAASGCAGDGRRLALVAQSVPTAAYLPCVASLPAGWTTARLDVSSGSTRFALESDRSRPVDVEFVDRCDVSGATPTTPRADGVRTYRRLDSITPRYRGTLFDVFAGGCVSYRFDFQRGPHIALTEEFQAAAGLRPRRELALELRRTVGVDLDG